jgi:hypothetical protein
MDVSGITISSKHERLHDDAIYCAPDKEGITKAAQDFLRDSHDLLHFLATPYALAKKLDATIADIVNNLMAAGMPSPNLIVYSEVMKKYDRVGFDLVTARILDLYLNYISDLLTLIFKKHKYMMKSSKSMKYEEILEHEDMPSLIATLAERTVNELSYQGFEALTKKLKEDFGLELVPDSNDYKKMLLGIEFRNLYVHAHGIVNSTYLSRVQGTSAKIGDVIDSSGYGFVPLIAKVVMDLDERAKRKFELDPSGVPSIPRRCSELGIV